MEPESKATQQSDPTKASEPVQQVAHAHQLLKRLSEKLSLDKHPELQEAITKLELALSKLTVDTGGMF